MQTCEQGYCRADDAVTKGDAVSGIDARSDAIHELVEEGSAVERLATGFTFTEGPIWHPGEEVLYFSDMPADIRRKVTLDGAVTEVRKPAWKCNGMTLDADHNLLVCEHVSSSLVRERPDGIRETLAYHYEGKYLNSPNDVTVRSDGTIYFSDPWYGRFPGFGIERARELGWQGVFRIPPGGGQDELRLAVDQDEFDMPNGLCFSPDESLLYINDTPRAHIKVFDVAADGTLSNGRMFYEGIGTGVIEEGIPDGMKCDERGNIWVTGPKGVWVISSSGELLGVVQVPEATGNLTWGGPDWHTLFIPSSSSVYTITTLVGPRREPYMG
jgi:gluconolactonase